MANGIVANKAWSDSIGFYSIAINTGASLARNPETLEHPHRELYSREDLPQSARAPQPYSRGEILRPSLARFEVALF